MSEKKQELQVAALENGTVIDHIPSENLFTVVSLLGLEHMNNNITIGFNQRLHPEGKEHLQLRNVVGCAGNQAGGGETVDFLV